VVVAEPVATHCQSVTQDTPSSRVSVAPCWFGVVASAQATPFHVSDSVLSPAEGDV
jgi:hypothetical protein